jgi:hypothetical protein
MIATRGPDDGSTTTSAPVVVVVVVVVGSSTSSWTLGRSSTASVIYSQSKSTISLFSAPEISTESISHLQLFLVMKLFLIGFPSH